MVGFGIGDCGNNTFDISDNNKFKLKWKMKELIIEWTINVVNFLIYILIFLRAMGTTCFNTLDLSAALVGVSAGAVYLFTKIMKRFK